MVKRSKPKAKKLLGYAMAETPRGRTPGEQDTYREFGRRLQALMVERGWNQSELARRAGTHLPKPIKGQIQRLGFHRDLISRYVRGVTIPRPEGLAALARALSVEESALLPQAGDLPTSSPQAMKTLPDGRVHYQLNRSMSAKTAFKISALLAEEDRLGK